MFGNLGLHIIQFPSKRWGYVGSIPRALGEEVPADTSAVMGCRSYRNERDEIVMTKFPVFATREEALAHATARGFSVIDD